MFSSRPYVRLLLSAALIGASPAMAAPPVASRPSNSQSIAQLSDAMAKGNTTSVAATRGFLARIAAIDRAGSRLRAVIALNPDALAQAQVLDDERASGKLRGPLHGVPILIKDNIESADAMPTTGGSLALKDNVTRRDAPLVARLRAAGAIILGKTNLSEWANIRSGQSSSGWSAVGGLTRNPHSLAHNTCGSSAGSGAAMAAELAAGTVGTETDGSVVCPSSINGIVGFKPTVGMVSRRFVVPISHSQDTAGPMTGSVRDAAIMLSVMAGSDANDPATAEADAHVTDFAAGLSNASLKGMRIGFITAKGSDAVLLAAARTRLKAAGAVLIPVAFTAADDASMGKAEFAVLLAELKADMATYLQGLPKGLVPHKTLADLIAFNKANAKTELRYFGQDIFVEAEKTKGLDDPAYLTARATSLRLAGVDGIDKLIAAHKLDLIVGQTNGPAWRTTLGKGDKFIPPSLSQLPAIAGYPHLTVPMGATRGLPVGLSFIGPKWSDALVLRAGHAFEVAGRPLRVTPRFVAGAPRKR
jgi:amidase